MTAPKEASMATAPTKAQKVVWNPSLERPARGAAPASSRRARSWTAGTSTAASPRFPPGGIVDLPELVDGTT
jgi:hypothetical protein